MKWNIDDLPVFVAVAEMRGVTGAAKRLSMPKSTVSRTLSRLENDLEVRLFNRNTREFNLTAEGVVLFQHAQVVMDHVKATDEAVAGLRHTPSGALKVSMPMAFSRHIIGGKLVDFTHRYPEVTIQLMVTPHSVNLMREDLDLAFVVGLPENSDVVAKKILASPLIWVASQSYANKHKLSSGLAELQAHLLYCERRYQIPDLPVRTSEGRHLLDMSQLMSVNDPLILKQIITDGGGVSLLPQIYCQDELQAGSLVTLFQDVQTDERAEVYALMPSLRLQPQKARLFIEFVEEIVADENKSYNSQQLSQ